MANRVPHGKAPIGAGRGKMDFKVLNRLMKQVFQRLSGPFDHRFNLHCLVRAHWCCAGSVY